MRCMKIEIHVHTKYSKDSLLSFWPLYIKCRLLDIKSIAITEHNNTKGGVEFKKFCTRHGNKVNVIVGEEIFTSEGEIIGLFLNEQITPDLSPEETIKQIKTQNGIVWVPHPYDSKRAKTVLGTAAIERCKDSIDYIEIHNGRNISPDFDIRQKEIADRYCLTGVVGSDAHTLMEIGRNYLYMESDIEPKNADEFKECLKYCSLHKSNCIKAAHKITKFAKLCKMLQGGRFHELHDIIIRKIKKR